MGLPRASASQTQRYPRADRPRLSSCTAVGIRYLPSAETFRSADGIDTQRVETAQRHSRVSVVVACGIPSGSMPYAGVVGVIERCPERCPTHHTPSPRASGSASRQRVLWGFLREPSGSRERAHALLQRFPRSASPPALHTASQKPHPSRRTASLSSHQPSSPSPSIPPLSPRPLMLTLARRVAGLGRADAYPRLMHAQKADARPQLEARSRSNPEADACPLARLGPDGRSTELASIPAELGRACGRVCTRLAWSSSAACMHARPSQGGARTRRRGVRDARLTSQGCCPRLTWSSCTTCP